MTEKKILLDILKAYKCLPCLWDTSDSFYSNKQSRRQALTILLEKYKALDSDVTVDGLRKKLEAMRTCYRRERVKVLQASEKGIEYTPKLWYYKSLLFLDKVDDDDDDDDDAHNDVTCSGDDIDEDKEADQQKFFDDADNSNEEYVVEINTQNNFENSTTPYKASNQAQPSNVRTMSTKEMMIDVLNAYKYLPCLWKPTDSYYTHKEARKQALEILLEKYKLIDNEATVCVLKKKLENLRSTYKREYKKVQIAEKYGEAYEPALWYFKYLLFLDDKEDDVHRRPSNLQFKEATHDILNDPWTSEEEQEPEIKTPKKRKMNESRSNDAVYIVEKSEPDNFATKITYDSFATQEENDHEAISFGNTVGLQLQKVDDMQRAIAQKLISDVIYYARLNQLTTNASVQLADF